MKFISPNIGATEVRVADEQPEYQPIIAAQLFQKDLKSRISLMRIHFDQSELDRLFTGEDLFIGLLTFGGPQQPMIIQVGSAGLNKDNLYDNVELF